MLQNIYTKVASINLFVWLIAYIAVITIYTQLPVSIWAIRPYISDLTIIMMAVILLAAFEKIRQA